MKPIGSLIIALLCAAVSFGFNSNSPGGGGAVAGGNCTGGQFMSGITTGGVPVCSTPSGGAPFPPGNVPQIGGYSALNTGESETVVGDFTFARSGANQYTATVTQINHITPGGTCTGSQFVNVISASGVPTCAALPAPAAGSITDTMLANGYSGIGACTGGQFVSTLNRNAAPTCTSPPTGFTAGGDLSGTATTQTVIGIRSTSVPVLASGYLHYTGAAFVWDTPATGSFAPTTNPAGGQNNYAPLANPTFTGTITLPAGSITDAMLSSGYSGIGACTAGTWVSTLNRNAAPTCTAPPSNYAPLTNPAGGQNNYAPLAAPTFTGAATMATLNLTGTAPALTFAGIAIGGTCGGGQFVNVISNTGIPTCATPATGSFAPVNNPAGGQNNYAPLASPNFTGSISIGGVSLSGLYAPLTNPAGGQNNYAPLASPTFTGLASASQVLVSNTTSSSILFGSSTTPYSSITATNSPNIFLGGGTHWTSPSWIADSTTAVLGEYTNTGYGFYMNSGLTVGNAFTPTQVAGMYAGGLNLYAGFSQLSFGPFGASQATLMSNAMGSSYWTSGSHYSGAAWVADSGTASLISNTGGLGVFANTGLTVGNSYTPTQLLSLAPSGMNLMSGTYQVNGTQIGTSNLGDTSQGAAYTPTLTTSNVPGTVTYSVQIGRWARVGPVATVSFYLQWTNWTGSPNGNIIVQLPVTVVNVANFYDICTLATSAISYGAGYTNMVGLAQANTNWMIPYVTGSGQAWTTMAPIVSGSIIGTCSIHLN